MKILWFTSSRVHKSKIYCSGTWVSGMIEALQIYYPELQIVLVTKGEVEGIVEEYTYCCKQWLLPKQENKSQIYVEGIENIIREESPDIIHVWGTEDFWGTLSFDTMAPGIPCLLEMQGVVSTVADNFYGELNFKEFLRCWSIKEFLKPTSSLPFMRHNYASIINRERGIIKKFGNISVQSEWSKAYVKEINPNATLYNTGIALRDEFYSASKWVFNKINQYSIFSTAITSLPLKGALTLVRAFSVVHKKYPNAKLFMAGSIEKGIRKSGYRRLIDKIIKKHRLQDSIIFLDKLDATSLIKYYQNCQVFVNPSHVESYSMVVAEAMYIGIPVVASYSGAMGELGPEGSVLYFPKSDYTMCAYLIQKLIEDPNYAIEQSRKSLLVSANRQNIESVSHNQYHIYSDILKNTNNIS